MMPCPSCGACEMEDILMPADHVHYAKQICANCGRFLRWRPRPPAAPGFDPIPAVRERIHPRVRAAPLRGSSEPQIRFARSVRPALLLRLERAGRLDLAAAARCVVAPSWWIANQARDVAAVAWPTPDQMEGPEPTGSCSECGALAYDNAPTCSDLCDGARARRLAPPHLSGPRGSGVCS